MDGRTLNALRKLAYGEYCIGPDGGIWSKLGPLEVGVESAIKELLDALELHWKGARSDWNPISTAPEDTDVLVYLPTDVYSKIRPAILWEGCWHIPDQNGYDVLDCCPTHWMHLPEMPRGCAA